MPRARAGEARLEDVVRGEGLEPPRELALGADKHLRDGGAEVVADDAQRHCPEVRERSYVPIEERDLIRWAQASDSCSE